MDKNLARSPDLTLEGCARLRWLESEIQTGPAGVQADSALSAALTPISNLRDVILHGLTDSDEP